MWRFSSSQDLPVSNRADGREPNQFRDLLINWGSIATANGSAIVKLGNTTVIGGVTFETIEKEISDTQTVAEIEECMLSDISNLIDVNVQFQPHSSFSFKIQANDQDAKESLIMSAHFKHIARNARLFDLKQLMRIEDHKVVFKKMCIEILVENYDGNSFDASNIAFLACLLDSQLDDDEMNRHLEMINFPVSTSFSVRKQTISDDENNDKLITPKEIVLSDPNLDDEKISDSMLNIVINAGTDQLILLNKIGGASISDECLKECIRIACKRANHIRNLLKSKETQLK